MDLLDCIILGHQINRFLNLRIMSWHDSQIFVTEAYNYITEVEIKTHYVQGSMPGLKHCTVGVVDKSFFVETALARTHRRDVIFEKCRRGLLREAFVREGEGG